MIHWQIVCISHLTLVQHEQEDFKFCTILTKQYKLWNLWKPKRRDMYITENVYFRNSLNSDFLPLSSYSFLYLMRYWVSIIGLTSWKEAWLVFYPTSLSIYTQQKHVNGGKWLPSMFHLSTSLTWLFFNGYSLNVSGESRLQCHSQCQHLKNVLNHSVYSFSNNDKWCLCRKCSGRLFFKMVRTFLHSELLTVSTISSLC